MPSMARVVASGMPHRVAQQGNRRQETFFSDDDYRAYLEVMAQRSGSPLRSGRFMDRLEKTSGRILRREKSGRKPKQGPK